VGTRSRTFFNGYNVTLRCGIQTISLKHGCDLRCARETQIRSPCQKSTMKQEDAEWKFFKANAHFIRAIWSGFPFYLVWERRSHTSFLALHPCLGAVTSRQHYSSEQTLRFYKPILAFLKEFNKKYRQVSSF